MKTGVTDIAQAIDAAGADAPEGLVTAQVRHPVRTIAFNVMRFASVIIGAGLLLRAGSSEQAISAINEEKPQPERPAKTRLVIPQPAFGQIATHEGNGETSAAKALADGGNAAAAVPAPAFAPQGGAHRDKLAKAQQVAHAADEDQTQPELQADTVALASSDVSVIASAPGLAVQEPVSAKARLVETQPTHARPASGPVSKARLASLLPTPAARTGATTNARALLDQPVVSAAKRTPAPIISAPKFAASAAVSAPVTLTPSILSPTRRSTAGGLLAPVRVVSRPVALPLIDTPALINTQALINTPAPSRAGAPAKTDLVRMASPIATGSSLASAKPQVAVRPAVAATSATGAPRQPAIAAITSAPSMAPGNAAPVKISLAPPVMFRGARTTVRTSRIEDVMRSPASAWDYAEALPPELMGHGAAVQRSASAEPVAQPQIAKTQVATAQARVASRQIAQAPSALAKPSTMRTAQQQQAANGPAPVTDIMRPAPQQKLGRPVASVAGENRLSGDPVSAKPPATGPVALLDGATPVRTGIAGPVPKSRLLALAAPSRQNLANAVASSLTGGLATAPRRTVKAKALPKPEFALVVPDEPPAPLLRAPAATSYEPVVDSNSSGTGSSALLADASLADGSSGDSGGLSLRDRIPRPAF